MKRQKLVTEPPPTPRPPFAVVVNIRDGAAQPGDTEVAWFDQRAEADRYVRWLVDAAANDYHFGPSETLTHAELCREVATVLAARGFASEDWHTGGGMFCVSVAEPAVPANADQVHPPDRAEWLFGMADTTWSGVLQWAESGVVVGEIPDASGLDGEQILTTPVPSDSQDVAAIAAAIETAITDWRNALKGEQ